MAELFQDHEINRTPHFSPRLLRLMAGSLLLHALFVAAVLYVPAVQSMFHLAEMFSGAGYVDERYEKGVIRERAQVINLARIDGKLYYPPGYFSKKKAPEPDAQVVAKVEPTPTPTPARRVKPTPTPTPTPLPIPTPAAAASPEVAKNKDGAPEDAAAGAAAGEEKEIGADQPRKEALDQLASQNKTKLPPKINVKPYKDLLAKYNKLRLSGDLDLSGVIQITLEADRHNDGTLTNMVMTGGSASNPILKEIAKDIVQALSASHALAFLEGARHLQMTLVMDQKKISVSAGTTLDSEERARNMASVYTAGIVYQRWKTGGKDEGAVWKNTSVAAAGNTITVRFEMARDTAGSLLAKQIPAN